MDVFQIKGPATLSGEIIPQGAKNEALQVIAATLLTTEKVTIHNVPEILDIERQIQLLKLLGVKVWHPESHTWQFQADSIHADAVCSPEFIQLSRNIRGSVLLTGPLLSRLKYTYLYKPGGDKIGRRRLDTHFLGFQKLGVLFDYDPSNGLFKIDARELKGAYIHLDEPSVTGTANIIMAAVFAKGKSVIYNAACEPYIQQLCYMLNHMGAKINGIGTNRITITGVDQLGGCTHTCHTDMIEIGSFIGLAAITGSEILIRHAKEEELGIIPATFNRLGIETTFVKEGLLIPKQKVYSIESQVDGSIPTIYDAPWPGFTPDLISIALVVGVQASGNLLIHQKMFESRLFFVDNLIEMGANLILCDPHRVAVIGLAKSQMLRGIRMRSPDIRAGVALLLAALSAEGTSKIYNIEQIDRGYERIDERLRSLGADIKRVDEDSAG